MRQTRALLVSILIFVAGALPAAAQCVSNVRDITGRFPSLEAGPVAWNGSTLAIAGTQLSTQEIWIAVTDEHGNPRADRFRHVDTELGSLIDLVAAGPEFALFYRDADNFLRMRRISPTTGEPLGNIITPVHELVVSDDDTVVVQWNAPLSAYFIVRTVTSTTPDQLWLTVLNANGSLRSDTQLASDVRAESVVRLAITESGTAGIFYEQNPTGNIRMIRIAPGFAPFAAVVWDPVADHDLIVTAHEENFVLVRSEHEAETGFFIWKIVATNSDVIRPESVLTSGTGREVRGLSIMSIGSELAMTYLDAPAGFELQSPRYRLFRFTGTGEEISHAYFAAVDPGIRRAVTDYDFVWTGSAYVSSAVLETGEVDESYLLRYCPLVAGVLGTRTVERNHPVTFTGAATGGAPPYEYEWRISGGNPIVEPSVRITYPDVGRFPIELTVRDSSGNTAMMTFFVDVVQTPPTTHPKRRSVKK